MKLLPILPPSMRISRAFAAVLATLLLPGCSQDYVSYDDVRLPASAEERFPIKVVDEPVKMSVAAGRQRLPPEQVNAIIGFARDARANGATNVSILYADGNRNGRTVAAQAADLIAAEGIPRAGISAAVFNGASTDVTLRYDRKVAETKDCGDWSSNLAGNQKNELYPNFGCTIQNNFAVMAENPEDFVTPRGLAPATGASRMMILKTYASGEWSQKQQQFPDANSLQSQ
jgi:pilus biogenesis lipoprotein CpaD